LSRPDLRPLDLWRHEACRIGPATLLTPVLVATVMAVGAAIAARSVDAVARTLFVTLEVAIPPAVGVGAASLVGRDPAVELQLSAPTSYRGTLCRRYAIMMGAGCLLAAPLTIILVAGGWWGRWPRTHGSVLGQLTWVAPMCWLAALGLLAGAVLRVPAAAATVVVGPWLAEQVLPGQVQAHQWSRLLNLFATTAGPDRDWGADRFMLIATAVLMTGAGWLLLGRPERLLLGETE
jgi:hypothetical protein